jgi:hypothetical protein
MRPDLAALHEHIAQVRREKETGIDTQGFEAAAALYDKEKDLLASKTAARRSGQTMLPAAWLLPRVRPGERGAEAAAGHIARPLHRTR